MNKPSIKVIKRKDVANAEMVEEVKPAAAGTADEATSERRTRREMVQTVANWISERREKKRAEEISAIRKIFGDSCLSEAGA